MKKRIKQVTNKHGSTLYYPQVMVKKKSFFFGTITYEWAPIRTCMEYWDPKHPHGCGTLKAAREYANRYQGKATVRIIDV